jgi:hypothetical protein
MARLTSRFILVSVSIMIAFVMAVAALPLHAQTTQRPGARGQTPPRPAAPRPANPPRPAAPPAAKPAEPPAPPKPVAQDLHMKTVYATGDQKTESVTYRKGERERFEFGDVVLLKQHDLKRTVQIMKAANTYMVIPDGATPVPPAPVAAPGAPPQKPGIVTMTTAITDTGERKMMFGLQARHAKMTIDKQPAPGACDPAKQHIETDGWYVDLPTPTQQPVPDVAPPPQAAAACVDEVKATQNGDPKVLGFPIAYSTTITGDDGKPNVVSMEITELEIANLDAALFDIPPGMNDAGNLQALTKAVSDADEAKLAQELTAPTPTVQKTIPGAALVGVPEVVNKTTQQIDTRALRGRLVSELAEAKLNAAPLAGSQTDIAQVAGSHGYDYVLVAEITDLKVSKAGGGLGGALKAASKLTGGGTGSDPTEAAVTIKLVQPDGKARFTTTAKGKDGGFDLKSGLGVAKFAGTMYMNMMTGKMMMNALNQSTTGKLGGMGMLGNPAMMNMQAQGLGMHGGMQMGMGMGIDPTAGAASFLMQQSMASNAALSGVPGQGGASFDTALGDALQNAAKAVADNLKKAQPQKK